MATAATAPRRRRVRVAADRARWVGLARGNWEREAGRGPQLLIFQCHALAKTPYLKLAELAGAAAPTPAFAANRNREKEFEKERSSGGAAGNPARRSAATRQGIKRTIPPWRQQPQRRAAAGAGRS